MVRTQKFDLDTDTTLGGDNASDYIAPSQKAIKDYVDNHSGGGSTEIYITQTYHNGASWYRVWSDGFIEQGGRSTLQDANKKSISFIKNFSSTPCVITTCQYKESAGTAPSAGTATNWVAMIYAATAALPTTTGFVVNRTSVNYYVDWYACGY